MNQNMETCGSVLSALRFTMMRMMLTSAAKKNLKESGMEKKKYLYLVSPHSEEYRYSGTPGQRLYKTLAGAEARVKKVKEMVDKRYYITRIYEIGE